MQTTKTDKLALVICTLFVLGALSMGPYKFQNNSPIDASIPKLLQKETQVITPAPATLANGSSPDGERIVNISSQSRENSNSTQNTTGIAAAKSKTAGFRSLPDTMSGRYDVPDHGDARPKNSSVNSSDNGGSGTVESNVTATTIQQSATTTSTTAASTPSTAAPTTTINRGGLTLDCPASTEMYCGADSTTTTTVGQTGCSDECDTTTTTYAEGSCRTTTTLIHEETAPEFGSVAVMAAILFTVPAYAFLLAKKK